MRNLSLPDFEEVPIENRFGFFAETLLQRNHLRVSFDETMNNKCLAVLT